MYNGKNEVQSKKTQAYRVGGIFGFLFRSDVERKESNVKKCKEWLRLFATMFKIGLFTFGGGYAMIALLENELVSKKQWMDNDEFMDMVAVAESTPGPIAVNSATYLGYKRAGVIGSAFATLGVAMPSFIIIFIISLFFDKFLSLAAVAAAFRGIQACVVFLILSAGVRMFKKLKKTALSMIVFGAVIGCMVAFSLFSVRFSSIFYILIAAVIGVAAYLVARLRRGDPPAGENDKTPPDGVENEAEEGQT